MKQYHGPICNQREGYNAKSAFTNKRTDRIHNQSCTTVPIFSDKYCIICAHTRSILYIDNFYNMTQQVSFCVSTVFLVCFLYITKYLIFEKNKWFNEIKGVEMALTPQRYTIPYYSEKNFKQGNIIIAVSVKHFASKLVLIPRIFYSAALLLVYSKHNRLNKSFLP